MHNLSCSAVTARPVCPTSRVDTVRWSSSDSSLSSRQDCCAARVLSRAVYNDVCYPFSSGYAEHRTILLSTALQALLQALPDLELSKIRYRL